MLKNVDRVRFARERNDTLRRDEVVVGVGVEESEVVRTRSTSSGRFRAQLL